MKLTKIYTRTGDAGETSLVGGIRVAKDSTRLEAYGTVDELSSHLGLLAALLSDRDLKPSETLKPFETTLYRVQNNLFNICTYLATDTTQTPVYPSAKLDPKEIEFLEENIDTLNKELPTLNSFILPGGCQAAAQCHVCRTVCRRAERRIVTLFSEIQENSTSVNSIYLQYINRLSDYLFVLARKLNIIYKQKEKTWQNTCI